MRRFICYTLILLMVVIGIGCSEGLPKEIISKDGAPMVLIPVGEFRMGTDESEIPRLVDWAKEEGFDNAKPSWFEDETPRHTVYLDAFYMDKYEVTNAQYKKFMDATGHKAPAFWNAANVRAPNNPVVGVSWHDAVAYAEWAGKRLPTEAEWEKAARGGLVGKRHVWGDKWPPPSGSGNFLDKTAKKWGHRMESHRGPTISGYDDGYAYAAPVGSYKPNGYGLHDMAGNVWEWCADWYGGDYYSKSPKSKPTGPESGSWRVFRGGSWTEGTTLILRVAARRSCEPGSAPYDIGFRCAMDAPK